MSKQPNKRIKRVVEPAQVAHLWAHKVQSDAHNQRKNIYFEGDTIYSYGGHFPIARHVTGMCGKAAILFTTRSYSSTTNKHIWAVRSAIPAGVPVFHIARVNQLTPNEEITAWANVKSWQAEYLGRAVDILTSACVKWSDCPSLINKAKSEISAANKMARFFGVKDTVKLPSALLKKANEFCKATTDRRAKHVARIAYNREHASEIWKERQRKREIERAKSNAEKIADWRAGGSAQYLGWDAPCAIRVKPTDADIIQTSKGAEFPLLHGQRAYRFLSSLRADGKTYQRNGHTEHVGDFAIDSMDGSGTVTAGCHVLPWDEIETFAKANGWA
jgi:hypothetical protein